ncbi:MAG: hypothetical protein ACRCZQ_10705 [Bacteroidales bacterium]
MTNSNINYRKIRKKKIAKNLIDIMQNDSDIAEHTIDFITNWCRTDASGKRKAFFDVWDLVLKNYLPATRPVLFRACDRLSKNGKIASFTGRLECARRFSKGKGALIVCDTEETLQYENTFYKPGEYEHSFYPLVSFLKKVQKNGGCGFTKQFLDDYIGEDEYIMRVNLDRMCCFRWCRNL